MSESDSHMRRTRIGIGVSVALNIFLLTFVGTQAWRHRHPDSFLAMSSAGTVASGDVARAFVQQLASVLPPEDGKVLRAAFVARLPELVRLQRASLSAAEQVRSDIGVHPFDVDKLRADMLAARQARQAIRPIVEDSLLEALPRMSDAGRQVLSEYRILPEK